MKKKRRLPIPVAVIIYLITTLLTVLLIVGNVLILSYSQIVTVFTGQSSTKLVAAKDEKPVDFFTSDFKNNEALHDYTKELGQEIVEEAIVLIKNDDSTLPLASGNKVSLLGQNSVDLIYGGGGAGSIDTSKAPDFKTVMKKSGFEINPTLWDFYTKGEGKDFRKETPSITGQGAFKVNEVPKDLYTKEVINSFADYQDAAIVTIGRSGGESADLSPDKLESGYHYLELDQEERDLLQLAQDNFEKVVVILNTSNPIELGFLKEYKIDACIWAGALGQTGAYGIGQVLNGKVNPSGRLVDTYAYDAFSSPAMVNFGDYTIKNSEVANGNKYVVYGEGIYVGYKYYETRYEDVILGNEEATAYDYATQVQYPFGYGLSYTNFAWTDYQVKETDSSFEVSLTISNKGKAAGKETVQLYLQSPYTDYDKENQIEKAAVQLVGFDKTVMIPAGQSETVKIEVPKEEMKTYDSQGHGTYIVDAGDYYLAAGRDAHEALNNILAAKGKTVADGMDAEGQKELTKKVTVDELDATTYAVSAETGKEINNQFEAVDIKKYDDQFTYLSRSDWEGTWPTVYQEGQLEASEQLLADLEFSHEENKADKMPEFEKVSKKYGKLSAAMLIGADYDDDKYQALLNQMSLEDMTTLVRMGGYATHYIESINLPGTINKDGPAGISSTLVGGGESTAMGYPAQVVVASTWNTDVVNRMGKAIGEDSLAAKVSGWYAPGINTHRLPFGGRNFEYFSEDSFISGKLSASEVEGAQNKGTFVFMKHFALNDIETNRMGGAMFANEQALREIYLKPFETTVREGDASGAMAGMNRIGARWVGSHKGLMTNTLRDEWDFRGLVITDQASFPNFYYQDMFGGLEAGTDMWLNTSTMLWNFSDKELTPTMANHLRKASHNIIYTIVNSNAMNGVTPKTEVKKATPKWKFFLLAADVVIGGLLVFIFFITTRKLIRQRREKKAMK
ncbi:glycoside hydrolase family 3 protein [uncultured Vagococcus sp.]|uniref:glycoside hydrolase family 3 protein n=1 Tax=uncultured Vagococcus sp. TaxID=189676 RepID=UPI0028D3B078|nr:glycoside hydrolase family 3 protein [uncultured Vagococcus sp.]